MAAGAVVWFTGRPAAGKSTLAGRLARQLTKAGVLPVILDSDELRGATGAAFGYDPRSRARFYRFTADLAALLARQGHVVLVAATAHRRAYRTRARARAPRFIEVFVDVPLATCAERDVKGLYRRARVGHLPLPGVGVPYEAPLRPEVVARGGRDRVAVGRLVSLLGRRG